MCVVYVLSLKVTNNIRTVFGLLSHYILTNTYFLTVFYRENLFRKIKVTVQINAQVNTELLFKIGLTRALLYSTRLCLIFPTNVKENPGFLRHLSFYTLINIPKGIIEKQGKWKKK